MPRRPKSPHSSALASKVTRALEHAAWMDEAACRDYSVDLWYGADSERLEDREVRVEQARAVCRRCPVRQECLETAIDNREPYGVWGGHTTSERKALARRRIPA